MPDFLLGLAPPSSHRRPPHLSQKLRRRLYFIAGQASRRCQGNRLFIVIGLSLLNSVDFAVLTVHCDRSLVAQRRCQGNRLFIVIGLSLLNSVDFAVQTPWSRDESSLLSINSTKLHFGSQRIPL
ncbi:hypothetical protein ACLB2K_054327 [Fragaria x ananassa]